MRVILSLVLVSALALLLGGCARFPDAPVDTNAPPRTLLVSVTVLGEIDPQYYYFLAIDTDGNTATGPVPIVTGSELGNGWGTLSNIGPDDPVQEPPFYVQYHNGTFAMFRNGQFIGYPYRAEVSADRKQMTIEIDQTELVPDGTPLPSVVQLNVITDEMINTPPQLVGVRKQYDAFGPTGNEYLSDINLNVSQIYISGENGAPEELPRDTTSIAAIDLIAWRVEVKINAP